MQSTVDKGRRRRDPAFQLIVLALAFIVLIVISAVTVFLVGRSRTDARLVEHTLAVQNKLSELHIQIRRADATHPGVLLLAKPYRKADLARMIRVALSEATPASTDAAA